MWFSLFKADISDGTGIEPSYSARKASMLSSRLCLPGKIISINDNASNIINAN